MYCIPFKKNIDKHSSVICFPIDFDIEVLTIYYDYGYLCDNNIGYAHLLEHMVIKISTLELKEICTNGIIFNAVTKEYTTEYTFINLRGGNALEENQKKIEQIFSEHKMGKIGDELFSTEKKIIMEELAILERQFSTKEAAKMVGAKKDIESFSIKSMVQIFKQYYKTHKTILLKNFENSQKEFESIQPKVKYNFNRGLVIQGNKKVILFEKCYETKIILFFLHICYISQLSRKWNFEMREEKNGIRIKIVGEFLINNKCHILNRYCLLCTSLKFYMEEIGWLVRNGLLELDIEKVFFEKWEGILYEC